MDDFEICLNKLNKEQQSAYAMAMSGKPLFITGGAGTGKSHTLRMIVEGLKRNGKAVIVCSYTGTAASLIGGSTIHKVFRFPTSACITPKNRSIVKRAPAEVQLADVIIIDEVSMCRMDLFDSVVASIHKAEEKSGRKKQLIVCGDFGQLPPILNNDHGERDVLEDYYKKTIRIPFAFMGEYWYKCNFQTAKLTEIVRQGNTDFQEHLNECRMGDTSCLAYFNSKSARQHFPNAVHLYCTNKAVDEENMRHLEQLSGDMYRFDTLFDDSLRRMDIKDVPKSLYLKEQARVIITINDNDTDVSEDPESFRRFITDRRPQYHNGSTGTIVSIQHDEEHPEKDYVAVKLDEGGSQIFYRQTYNIYEYVVENDVLKRHILGTYRQFPVRPAYAVTIHKSQGQTYDYVNLDPYCKASGQLYVALSRVRSIDHLYLDHRIQKFNLMVDPLVIEFYDRLDHPEKYLPETEPEKSEKTAEKPATEANLVVPEAEQRQPQKVVKVKAAKKEKQPSRAPTPKGGRPPRFPSGSRSMRVPNEISDVLNGVIDTLYPKIGQGQAEIEKVKQLKEYLQSLINDE